MLGFLFWVLQKHSSFSINSGQTECLHMGSLCNLFLPSSGCHFVTLCYAWTSLNFPGSLGPILLPFLFCPKVSTEREAGTVTLGPEGNPGWG